jgi:hypothetical protein
MEDEMAENPIGDWHIAAFRLPATRTFDPRRFFIYL